MSPVHAVILALVQAITEFLPVSSTAHLILVPWLLGWEDHGLLFDIALHLGTLAGVIVYFFKTWVRLAFLAIGREVWKPDPGEPDYDLYQNPKLFLYLVAATLPAGLAGLALKDLVESTLRSPVVIGVMLIAVGLLIYLAEKAGTFRRDLGKLSFRDAMLIGCAQAVALIPGTSRSGVTISTAMLLGISRHAARFSFLLSTPIILGAGLKASLDARRRRRPGRRSGGVRAGRRRGGGVRIHRHRGLPALPAASHDANLCHLPRGSWHNRIGSCVILPPAGGRLIHVPFPFESTDKEGQQRNENLTDVESAAQRAGRVCFADGRRRGDPRPDFVSSPGSVVERGERSRRDAEPHRRSRRLVL